MSEIEYTVTHPQDLKWWQWGKIVGIVLPITFYLLEIEHLFLWAVAAHFFVDFTAQSYQTVLGKAKRN